MSKRHVGGATALALALFLSGTIASAQTACLTTACMTQQSSDQTTTISGFNSLLGSTQGLALLQSGQSTVVSIYQNATPALRALAIVNDNLSKEAVETNIWAMVPGTVSQGVQAIFADHTKPTYSALKIVDDVVKDTVESQATALKASVSSVYSTAYGYIDASTGNPRPFLTTPAIANNPWGPAQASASSIAGQTEQWASVITQGSFPSMHSMLGNSMAVLYGVLVPEMYQGLLQSAAQFGLSRNILGVHYPTDIIGGRILAYANLTQLLANNTNYVTGDFASAVQQASQALHTSSGLSISVPYASCASNVAGCMANGMFPSAAQFTAASQAYANLLTYELPSVGATSAAPVVPTNAYLLIASRFPYLSSTQLTDILATTELPSGVPLDNGTGWARLNLGAATSGYGAFNSAISVTMNASQGGFNAIDMWSNNISGTGSLTKLGTGVLVLGGTNTYSGGTTVGGGTLALTGTMTGNLSILSGATFISAGGYSIASGATLDNAGTFQSVGATLVNAGTLTNSGTLNSNLNNSGTFTNTGTFNGSLTNTGTFTTGTGYTLAAGETLANTGTFKTTGTFGNQGTFSNTGTFIGSVNSSGSFANNGTITGNFTNQGRLSGNGTITGTLVNSGVVAPGNSIGTVNVVGSFTQNAGTLQVETNAAGQADRINVSGAPGTATLNGGTVALTGATGVYAPSTTYVIVNATGGVTGTFAGVSSLYPFLLPSLSYDANNAYLTVRPGGFSQGAATANQAAVGRALDRSVAGATGDFAQVIGTLATFTLSMGQAAMNAISGQNYSGFSTANVVSGRSFANVLGQQMVLARGGAGTGTRMNLAEACEIEVCEDGRHTPWSIWGSASGATGSLAGNGNSATLTYNAGGFATGIDYLVDPHLLVGMGIGYLSGNQWLGGFSGRGTSNSHQASLYASFTEGPLYVDTLAAVAFNDNQMTRQIVIPGLQARLAQGQTTASQLMAQSEVGYRIGIDERSDVSVSPFLRFQAMSIDQAAFSETGAGSLSLSVAQQTTNSIRTVIGMEMTGAIEYGWRDKLELQMRLGWSHEYANVARPVSASFTGAPGSNFTVFGATPPRDSAIFGFAANTSIARSTSLYARYDGEFAVGTANHSLTAGFRLTW